MADTGKVMDLARLKSNVEKAEREKQQAKGALDRAMKQLKEKFDCKTLDQAQALLEESQAKEEEAEAAFENALAEFKKEWSAWL